MVLLSDNLYRVNNKLPLEVVIADLEGRMLVTKREYINFHLICILRLQNNESAKNLVKEHTQELSRKQINMFYLAVTGRIRNKRINSLELKKLYKKVFKDDVVKELTPSQEACLWQGRFEYGKLYLGYTERDYYKEVNLSIGQHIYALASSSICQIPDYFFTEEDLATIKMGTAMDAYALLQLDPYWSGGYGARTIVNEYEVIEEFIGAKGYALNNHHLSREHTSDEPLTDDEKIKNGIGKHHIECEPYDENHIDYEYILPPCGLIFVPKKCKKGIKLYEKEIYQLKDDMADYKRLYKKLVMKAQNNRLNELYFLYEQNKRFNQLP